MPGQITQCSYGTGFILMSADGTHSIFNCNHKGPTQMKAFKPINNIRDIRKKLGLNQIDFWGQVGVTQSGGSRYEAGRNMPKPVRELVRLVHIEQLDISKLSKTDVLISEKLKEKHPDIYKALKAEVAKA